MSLILPKIRIVYLFIYYVPRICDPSLKMQIKWSAPCTAPISTWFLMLSSNFIRATADQKWSTVHIFRQELPGPNFPVLIEFKSIYKSMLEKNFPLFLIHARCGESLITLSLWAWKVLSWTAFLGSIRSGLNV